MVLTMKLQLALWRDRADGREMLVGVPLPQEGGLAAGGVGAHDPRHGIEARFIYQEDGLLRVRPLLRAGQVSSRPWAIAASSHWRARRAGCCGLQRSAWHTRPT